MSQVVTMRRRLLPAAVTFALAVALILDDGADYLGTSTTWIIAWADLFLIGRLLGWLLAKITPGWDPPGFAWKWFDFFRSPEDCRESTDA